MSHHKNYWNATTILSISAAEHHRIQEEYYPYVESALDLTLFVSCYNEAKYIIDTLNVIKDAMQSIKKTYEILIIDDGSKDNSVEIVQNYIQQHSDTNIILRINKKNKGLAQNYIDGAFIGRGKYYRLICGDNAEPKDTLLKVLNMMGEADIIIPYYISAEGKSLYRRFISKAFTWIINTVSGNDISYYNGLQLHLRHNIMRWHPNTKGFGFQADILCTLISKGFTYKEVPCITIERRGGKGNALTWKNLISVKRTILSILVRRIAPWT